MEVIVIIAYFCVLVGEFVLECLYWIALFLIMAITALFEAIFGKKDNKNDKK